MFIIYVIINIICTKPKNYQQKNLVHYYYKQFNNKNKYFLLNFKYFFIA